MIDPMYNDTVAAGMDQWIPIRPGTDAALVEGHCLRTDQE